MIIHHFQNSNALLFTLSISIEKRAILFSKMINSFLRENSQMSFEDGCLFFVH